MKYRFFEKVLKTENCWLWTAALRGKSGYGCMKVDGKVVDSHRLSWEIHFGKIPEGLLVCHTCDNRICVNPAHLFLGTQSDNMKDCLKKGRMFIPKGFTFENGSKPANRLLSDSEVVDIKKAIVNKGRKTLRQISEEMGYKNQLFLDISCGRIYKNISPV